MASFIIESYDELIEEILINVHDLLMGGWDIAVINAAPIMKEKNSEKEAVKVMYVLPTGKTRDKVTRCRKPLDLYRLWERKTQNYAQQSKRAVSLSRARIRSICL